MKIACEVSGCEFEYNNGWFDPKVKLPEKSGRYLVNVCHGPNIATFHDGIFYKSLCLPKDYEKMESRESYAHVKHWTTIPEIP